MSSMRFPYLTLNGLQDTIKADIPKTDTNSVTTIHSLSDDSLSNQLFLKNKSELEPDAKTARKADTLSNIPKKIQEIQIKKATLSEYEPSLQPKSDESASEKDILSWNQAEDFAGFLYPDVERFKVENDSIASDTLIASVEVIHTKKPFFSQRFTTSTDWVFWTFVIMAFLFVWIQIFYRKYMVNLFNSVFSFQASSRLFNEKNLLARRVSVVLNFIYTISISLVIFRITQYFNFEPENFDDLSFFLVILNIVILFSVLKALFQKFIGYIFSSVYQINEYLHNVYVFNKSFGIVILPISFSAYYTQHNISEILILTIVAIYIFSLLFKIVRSFQIIIKHDIFIFYLILYLCTLEFLPVMIGYKFIKSLT